MNPEAVMRIETIEAAPEPHAMHWMDGGMEAAPLGLDPPQHEPATERDADPSWKVL